MGGLWFVVFWFLSLYSFCWVASSSTFWVVGNRIEAFLMGLHKFDPGKMRTSQPFSDPGFSPMICSSWLVVGYTGFLSMFPYFDDLARDPAFIYSVTMSLWWYALISYTLCSPKNFLLSIFLGPKNALYFFGMMILEAVSWMTRGFTFGARFLISGTFGTCVSYVMCDMLCSWSFMEGGLLNWGFLFVGAFLWNIYEVLAISFQCYLIGLLGICFCNPHPMGFSSGGSMKLSLLEKKRSAKKNHVLSFYFLWEQFSF